MDGQRFDGLTRAMGAGVSRRRGLLAGLAALAAGAIGIEAEAGPGAEGNHAGGRDGGKEHGRNRGNGRHRPGNGNGRSNGGGGRGPKPGPKPGPAGCAGGPCAVFATSEAFSGALEGAGGLAAADGICARLATAAGLQGTFMAWLSVGSDSPAARFPTRSALPYVLVNGTEVAADWAELTSGSLAHAIDLDENGDPASSVNDTAVWTATTAAGAGGGADCAGWTSGASGASGLIGVHDAAWDGWTDLGGTQNCSEANLLYCVQQD